LRTTGMASPRLIAKTESEEPALRLAVLIDADNAQAAVIEGLLAGLHVLARLPSSESTATSHHQSAHPGKKFCKSTQLNPSSNSHTQRERMRRTAR
jgi:hypothetical protein